MSWGIKDELFNYSNLLRVLILFTRSNNFWFIAKKIFPSILLLGITVPAGYSSPKQGQL